MIIIEGPDGTGKTTFAEKLRAAFGYSKRALVHTGPPPKTPPHMPSGAWTQYLDMLQSPNVPSYSIMDRFIYGEMAYGPVFRNDERFTAVHLRMLERLLFTRRSVVLFFEDSEWSKNNWLNRSREGKEMLLDPAQYDRVAQRFREIYTMASLPVLHVAQQRATIEDNIDGAAAWINRMRPPLNQAGGHGMFHRNSIVLAGDFRSSNTQPFDWPCIDYQGYGHRFTSYLDKIGVAENELYWFNVLSDSGNLRDGSWLDVMQPKHVIAFGDAGETWLHEYGMKTSWSHVPGLDAFYRRHPFADHPALHILQRKIAA